MRAPVEDTVAGFENRGLAVAHLNDLAVGLPLTGPFETAFDLKGHAVERVFGLQVEIEPTIHLPDVEEDVEGRKAPVFPFVLDRVELAEGHGTAQRQIVVSLPARVSPVDHPHPVPERLERIGLEPRRLVVGLEDVHRLQIYLPVAHGERSGASAHSRGRQGPPFDPPQPGRGEDPAEIVRDRLPDEGLVAVPGVCHKGMDEPGPGFVESVGTAGNEMIRHGRPDTVAVPLGHVEERIRDPERHHPAPPVLSPGHVRHHRPVRVKQADHHIEVPPDRVQQLRPPQVVRHEPEGAITRRIVDPGTPLRKLPIFIDIYGLRQDAFDIVQRRQFRKERHRLGQSGADYPPMVGSVEAKTDAPQGAVVDVFP